MEAEAPSEVRGACWIWTGYTMPNGYGLATLNGKRGLIHRIVYELLVGPIPEGLHLDHLCRVRACANPDHLEPVTPEENARRGAGPGGAVWDGSHSRRVPTDPSVLVLADKGHGAKAACPHGHPYDVANTRVYRGRRWCRACDSERGRRKRAERAAVKS